MRRAQVIGISCGTLPTPDGTPRFGANQAYVRALQQAGAAVVLVPPVADGESPQVVASLDGLLLPGGADVDPACYGAPPSAELGHTDPQRDRSEIALVRAAVDAGTPVLGICRGQQLINVALGGTLHQDIGSELHTQERHQSPKEAGRDAIAHEIDVMADSWLGEVVRARTLRVNSLHHQSIKDVAAALRVTAASPDGIVEGVETADRRIVAVQCHPEELLDTAWARDIFRAFVDSTRR